MIGAIKGDTRSLDYSSYGIHRCVIFLLWSTQHSRHILIGIVTV